MRRLHRWIGAAAIGVVLIPPATVSATTVAEPPGSQPAATAAGTIASTYLQGPGHDGVAQDPGVTFPLQRAWSISFDDAVSYPVIAEGKVFVTIRGDGVGGYGTRLVALSAATGRLVWGPVPLSGTYYFSGLTYANGVLVSLNWNGELRSFTAANGQERWNQPVQLPGVTTSPPNAVGDRVYVTTGGLLQALDLATGATVWSAPVENSDHNSPAVAGNRVVVSSACNRYAFSLTGAPAWHHNDGCIGGGGKTPAVNGGRVVSRRTVLDAEVARLNDGAILGTTRVHYAPTFAGGYRIETIRDASTGYVRQVRAAKPTTGQTAWTVTTVVDVALPPLTVNGKVIVALANGRIEVRRPATGAVASSISLPEGVAETDEQNAVLTSGMAAGQGIVVICTPHGLVALR